MTSDEMVEAMARGIAEAMGCKWETLSNLGRAGMCDLARAAIRACHAAGGLVLREVPAPLGPNFHTLGDDWSFYPKGHNDALAKVRAAAVEKM